jgi:hypothetical protein
VAGTVAVIVRGAVCGCFSKSKNLLCKRYSRLDVMLEISETAWVVHMVFIRICYDSKVASGNARRGVAMSLFGNHRSYEHLLCLLIQFGRGRALLIGP